MQALTIQPHSGHPCVKQLLRIAQGGWWRESANRQRIAQSLGWGFIPVRFGKPPAFGCQSVAANSRTSKLHFVFACSMRAVFPPIPAQRLVYLRARSHVTIPQECLESSADLWQNYQFPLLRHQSDKYMRGGVHELRAPT